MTAALLLCLTLPLSAAPCVVGWDAQPGMTFEVWSEGVKLASVATNQAEIDLPTDRLSTVRVVAVSEGVASLPSAPLTVRPVICQRSADLATWASTVVFIQDSPTLFFRVATPGIPTLQQ